MEKIRSEEAGARYQIPEIATFGLRKLALEMEHAGLVTKGEPIEVPPNSQAEYLSSLNEIEVGLEGSGSAWGDQHEGHLQSFVDAWPELSHEVLEAIFEHYRTNYADLRRFAALGNVEQVILPEPSRSEVVKDLFTIRSIHLSPGGDRVGLAGSCTWDEENAIGLVVEKGKVISIGDGEVARHPSSTSA